MDPKQWPDDDSRLLFGDETILRLCKKFSLPAETVVQQFRNVKDGKEVEVTTINCWPYDIHIQLHQLSASVDFC